MKRDEMIQWLRSKLGCGYVYGAYGQICTQKLLDELQAKWGSRNYNLAKKWMGLQVFDCVNLIKVCYRALTGNWVDVSADGLHKLCNADRALISAKPGDLLFRIRKGVAEHVGVVTQPGTVLEARSTLRGVVEGPINLKDWSVVCDNPWLESEPMYDPIIERAVDFGIISSPEVWQDYFDGKAPVRIDHLKALMTKYHAQL